MKRLTRCLWSIPMLLCSFLVTAQVDNPYHVNGNAFQETCNCYTLTPDEFNQAGSVWNINKISLKDSFDFNFNIFLGCKDGDGADGIAFVLQPISTSIGAVGGGMGYEGISPSVGVVIDTWQNYEDSDPLYDHIAIHRDGRIDHSSLFNATPAVPVLASGGNIEDCAWHTLHITWDPVSNILNVQVDGIDRVRLTADLVAAIFSGSDEVYWGFTSATGGARNLQKFCTSLNPGFFLPTNQTTCYPDIVTFIDSSSSFGKIEKWYWDFGDGTTFNESTPPPHQFPAPGNYDVKLSILGNNGCISDTFVKTIVMGSEPLVRFSYPTPVCEGTPVAFVDSSFVEFGTIDKWHWNIAGTDYTSQSPPPLDLTGTTNVSLNVGTKEGCVSSVASGTVTAFPHPSADFQLSDVCFGQPVILNGMNTDPSMDIIKWSWSLGNGASRVELSPRLNYIYPDAGEYNIGLTAYSKDGCPSLTVTKSTTVYRTDAFAGNDTIIAIGQAIQLHGSGGEVYKWTPSQGLSDDNIPDPVLILDHDAQYVLTTSTIAGCPTSDTVRFKVFKGPALYVPTAFSPNNDGYNDKFTFIAVGMRSVDLFQVFNRYGQMIYSSTEFNKGWDGNFNGTVQPSGTYVWLIRGTDLNGAPHFKRGTVTLVR